MCSLSRSGEWASSQRKENTLEKSRADLVWRGGWEHACWGQSSWGMRVSHVICRGAGKTSKEKGLSTSGVTSFFFFLKGRLAFFTLFFSIAGNSEEACCRVERVTGHRPGREASSWLLGAVPLVPSPMLHSCLETANLRGASGWCICILEYFMTFICFVFCGGQRTACEGQFSSPVLLVVGIELGLSGLAKSTLLSGAVLLGRSGCLHPVLYAVRA